jgi:hypothetical protein
MEVRMTEDTTKLETAVSDAAEQAGVEESTIDKTIAESKTFLSKAQEALTDAVDTVVEAVKEHPITAAGIAAGATAAVAGAAYGASRLLAGDDSDDDGSTKSGKKKS